MLDLFVPLPRQSSSRLRTGTSGPRALAPATDRGGQMVDRELLGQGGGDKTVELTRWRKRRNRCSPSYCRNARRSQHGKPPSSAWFLKRCTVRRAHKRFYDRRRRNNKRAHNAITAGAANGSGTRAAAGTGPGIDSPKFSARRSKS